jgi:hypothetical protein
MAELTTLVNKAGDRVISAVKQAQDLTVAAVSTVTETIGNLLPDLPTLPFAEQIPAPKELVKTTFSLADKWLDAQKSYALDLADALAPVTGKVIPNGRSRKSGTTAKAKA